MDGPTYDTLSALAARAGSVSVVTFLELVESTTDGEVGGSTDPSGLPVQVWQVQTLQEVSGAATPSTFQLAILDPTVVSSHQDPVAVGDRRVAFVYPVATAGATTYFVAGLGQGLVPVGDDGTLVAPASASPTLAGDIDRVGSLTVLRAELDG